MGKYHCILWRKNTSPWTIVAQLNPYADCGPGIAFRGISVRLEIVRALVGMFYLSVIQ